MTKERNTKDKHSISEPTPESKEQLLPATSITLLLAPHSEARHITGLRQHLTSDTLFIPELSGWKEEDQAHLQAIADGRKRPAEVLALTTDADTRTRPYQQQLLTELQNTQAKVLLVDTTPEDGIHQALDRVQHQVVFSQSYEATLENLKSNISRFVELQDERDQLMVERLLQSLTRVDRVKNSRVVMTLGSQHHTIVNHLSANKDRFAQLELTTVTNTTPEDTPRFEDDIVDKIKAGEAVSYDLLSQALLERIISSSLLEAQLHQALHDTFAVQGWIRRAVEQFSTQEIRELYQEMVVTHQNRLASGEVVVVGGDESALAGLELFAGEVLVRQPKDKGITIPESQPIDDDEYLDWQWG